MWDIWRKSVTLSKCQLNLETLKITWKICILVKYEEEISTIQCQVKISETADEMRVYPLTKSNVGVMFTPKRENTSVLIYCFILIVYFFQKCQFSKGTFSLK